MTYSSLQDIVNDHGQDLRVYSSDVYIKHIYYKFD